MEISRQYKSIEYVFPCPGLSSIQITDESGSKVLVNISAAAADSAATAPGAQQLQLAGNSTQGEQLGSWAARAGTHPEKWS